MLDSLDTLISFALIMLIVSLLITIVVQMFASALNLRGTNLAHGLADTLETIVPGTKKQAKEFVDHVLQSPMISDSSSKRFPGFWRRATAVRADEVFDAIHRIALGRQDAPEELKLYAQNLLIALGIDKTSLDTASDGLNAAKKSVKDIVATASDAITAVPDENLRSKLTAALTGVSSQLTAYAAAEAARLTQATAAAAGAVDNAFKKFQYWSDMAQERVQQWFTMHTRFLTVFFAIIFALLLQLDTIEIFKLVSTNRTVRDKLVAQATTVASQAEKILSDSKSVLKEALNTFIDKQEDQDIKSALKSITVDDFDTRGSLVKKVNAALSNAMQKGKKPISDIDSVVNETASNRLDQQAGDFKAVKSGMDQTGFELFPSGSKWRWGPQWQDNFSEHYLGILFSTALLSLGAPFWYNILKSLTSLRSTVAKNISEEQKQTKKQLESDSPPGAPPTVLLGR